VRTAEAAVRETISRYQAAYADLDVQAAAAIWPSVDRRALGRAFAALESQGLVLDSCEVRVEEPTATAHCRGEIAFVRKVGPSVQSTVPQQWLFKMRRSDEEWIIEAVAASQDPG
jgi:hypothetical protein